MHGFLSQYLRVEPREISGIEFNKSKNFTIVIDAPDYFTKGSYELLFTIEGWITTEGESKDLIKELKGKKE